MILLTFCCNLSHGSLSVWCLRSVRKHSLRRISLSNYQWFIMHMSTWVNVSHCHCQMLIPKRRFLEAEGERIIIINLKLTNNTEQKITWVTWNFQWAIAITHRSCHRNSERQTRNKRQLFWLLIKTSPEALRLSICANLNGAPAEQQISFCNLCHIHVRKQLSKELKHPREMHFCFLLLTVHHRRCNVGVESSATTDVVVQ